MYVEHRHLGVDVICVRYALGWQALSCRDLVEAARRLLARTNSNAAAATVDAGTYIVLPIAGMAVRRCSWQATKFRREAGIVGCFIP